MTKTSDPPPRLYAIQAREAPLAVIFRRGPSKQVQLILWRTDTDEFISGQWFKGRIYERQCDLSPDGKRLIYFAAKYKAPLYTWTAISRPPYFTAVALWQTADAWAGGGRFASNNEILLANPSYRLDPAEGFTLPRNVKVKSLRDHPIVFSDADIRERDGWKLIRKGLRSATTRRGIMGFEIDPPKVWSKYNPAAPTAYELRELTLGKSTRDDPSRIEFVVLNRRSQQEQSLGRIDWADWAPSGDLLFARKGQIFRAKFDRRNKVLDVENAQLLIDLCGRKFCNVKAPPEATSWNGEFPLTPDSG